jgi:hypothetical protein
MRCVVWARAAQTKGHFDVRFQPQPVSWHAGTAGGDGGGGGVGEWTRREFISMGGSAQIIEIKINSSPLGTPLSLSLSLVLCLQMVLKAGKSAGFVE